MKITPLVLVRIAGHTFDDLDKINSKLLGRKTEELFRLGKAHQELKISFCDLLLEFIRSLQDSKDQNIIQNFRRNIYNGKKINPATLSGVRGLLTEVLLHHTDQYFNVLAEYEQIEAVAVTLYKEELEKSRSILKSLSKSEDLRKGLSLASQTLLKELKRFDETEPRLFGKKEFNIETSLLKFITRMCAKTSPFSTFTNLFLAEMSDDIRMPVQFKNEKMDVGSVEGHVLINNYLFRYLISLFLSYRDLYQHFYVRVNPTVRTSGDQLLYLTTHYNIESFQKISKNAILEIILHRVNSHPKGISFAGLRDEVCELTESTLTESEDYIKNLVDIGFLEFDLGISGLDPQWDVKLISVLQVFRNDIPVIEELIIALSDIRSMAMEFITANSEQRLTLMDAAFKILFAVCMKLHEAAGLPLRERENALELIRNPNFKSEKKEEINTEQSTTENEKKVFRRQQYTIFNLKAEQMFYEDTTRDLKGVLDSTALTTFITRVDLILNELDIFEGSWKEKNRLSGFFKDKYGDADVELLTFHEDYSRFFIESQKGGNQMFNDFPNQTPTGPESLLAFFRERNLKIEKWKTRFREVISPICSIQDGKVALTLSHIKQVNDEMGISTGKTTNRLGAFIQFYAVSEKGGTVLKGVLNNCFPGMVKLIARFLHTFPDEVTNQIRQLNTTLKPEGDILMENTDSSFFNANIHPPLLPFEIRVPGGNNSVPVENQLSVTDFIIRFDDEQNCLTLIHKPTGKKCFAYNFGLQAQFSRTPLFGTVEKLSTNQIRSFYDIQQVVNTEFLNVNSDKTNSAKITQYPRIDFENFLTIQRRHWIIPRELMPIRQPGDTDAGYFYQFNKWRIENKIDGEVFLHITKMEETKKANPDQHLLVGKDDYKPQYMNFNNPVLFKLFEKLLKKTPTEMKMTEMIPDPESLLRVADQRFVMEYLVEWENQ